MNYSPQTEQTLKPGVYRLIKYDFTSTEERPLILGKHPEGYLIYDDVTHGLAAHLWNPERLNRLSLNEINEDYMQNFMLGNLYYCGHYTSDAENVYHHVKICSVQNFVGQTMTRGYQYGHDRSLIIISTDMSSERVDASSGIYKLIWEPAKTIPQFSGIIGCWELVEYVESGKPILGQKPHGQILFTSEGYFSMQLAHENRALLSNHIQSQVTKKELSIAFQTSRGLAGTFNVDELSHIVHSEVLSPTPYQHYLTFHFAIDKSYLTLDWENFGAVNHVSPVKTRWRLIKKVRNSHDDAS